MPAAWVAKTSASRLKIGLPWFRDVRWTPHHESMIPDARLKSVSARPPFRGVAGRTVERLRWRRQADLRRRSGVQFSGSKAASIHDPSRNQARRSVRTVKVDRRIGPPSRTQSSVALLEGESVRQLQRHGSAGRHPQIGLTVCSEQISTCCTDEAAHVAAILFSDPVTD
jgi:hypothetical protein